MFACLWSCASGHDGSQYGRVVRTTLTYGDVLRDWPCEEGFYGGCCCCEAFPPWRCVCGEDTPRYPTSSGGMICTFKRRMKHYCLAKLGRAWLGNFSVLPGQGANDSCRCRSMKHGTCSVFQTHDAFQSVCLCLVGEDVSGLLVCTRGRCCLLLLYRIVSYRIPIVQYRSNCAPPDIVAVSLWCAAVWRF